MIELGQIANLVYDVLSQPRGQRAAGVVAIVGPIVVLLAGILPVYYLWTSSPIAAFGILLVILVAGFIGLFWLIELLTPRRKKSR